MVTTRLEQALLELADAICGLVDELEPELQAIAVAAAALVNAGSPVVTPVLYATEAELERLGIDATSSAIAASALTLARELDGVTAKASEIASCQRALVATIEKLRAVAPVKDEGGDTVDEVTRKREERRAHVRRAAT